MVKINRCFNIKLEYFFFQSFSINIKILLVISSDDIQNIELLVCHKHWPIRTEANNKLQVRLYWGNLVRYKQ